MPAAANRWQAHMDLGWLSAAPQEVGEMMRKVTKLSPPPLTIYLISLLET